MPKIQRKSRAETAIPTGSMGDIVFLLLIFFMVTTVFVEYRGIKVTQPKAEMTERIDEKSLVTHMWISRDGDINIDDYIVLMDQISQRIYPKRRDEPRLIVSIIADVNAPYGIISDAMRQLREVDALNVNFATLHTR